MHIFFPVYYKNRKTFWIDPKLSLICAIIPKSQRKLMSVPFTVSLFVTRFVISRK
ncbi:hypothetical protein C1646_698060 [Rhizophagus diaphanus]|nr:hypothetical protein C1646_698060 [Rhizophagus diaphanus] [Rhizophagus sp. MUCL 43196]